MHKGEPKDAFLDLAQADRFLLSYKRGLISRAEVRRYAAAFLAVEHLAGDGATVFDHVCRMRLEGMRIAASET